jgi:hypothetical protein
MLPQFTEWFVDKKATGKYYGGYFADDFESYVAPRGSRKELRILSKLSLSHLVRNKINNLVAIMHDIYPDTTSDDEFMFAILPIAYSLMVVGELIAEIDDPDSGIAISANLKRNLQYVLGG